MSKLNINIFLAHNVLIECANEKGYCTLIFVLDKINQDELSYIHIILQISLYVR